MKLPGSKSSSCSPLLADQKPVPVRMAVQGGSYQRYQGQRNRGRIFIIAIVLAFLFFNFGYRVCIAIPLQSAQWY
jgi:hypothetical protein